MHTKKVAIIIPHFNGIEIVDECLRSLEKTVYNEANVYVVDNNSSDDSVNHIKSNYSWVHLFELSTNLGYSGGCNYGFEHTNESYVIFLNNDTIHEENWLSSMIELMESDDHIGAIQPKIRSYYDRNKFDYSGACGGELDYLGYPFARGRIFEEIEADTQQYDNLSKEIFWASGTAMCVLRSALDEVGTLDDEFFAHMEEIDLSWRLKLFNYKVCVEPKSIIYHHSGYTLSKMNYLKMYLNHRNNLFMLYKNLDSKQLYPVFLKRFIFEIMTFFYGIVKFDFKRSRAVIHALFSFIFHVKKYRVKRQTIQKNKKVQSVKCFDSSIVLMHYIKKKNTYSDLFLN